MGECDELADILDSADGVRRIQRGLEAPWENVICYGKAIRTRPFAQSQPIWRVSVLFVPWIRGEASLQTSGDLILADIEAILIRMWNPHHPADVLRPDCQDGTFRLMDTRFEFSTEPEFQTPVQAWTQQHRIAYDIVVPTCRAVAPCLTCP
jgi:hypothetical protein